MDSSNKDISSKRIEPEPGVLYIVGTPIGNLGDFSPRAKDLLSKVSLIACEDTRRSGKLLKAFSIKTPLLSFHKHNTNSRIPKLLELISTKQSIALISDAGLPIINDPGEELVHASKLNHHEVICIPGPCAATTALVISGLSSRRFCFEGFLPKKQNIREQILKDISKEERTTIIYESPHKLLKLLEDLAIFCGEERLINVSKELTKRYEKNISSTIKEVLEYFKKNKPKGEFTIVLEGKNKRKKENKISKSQVLIKLEALISKGEKSNVAAKIIAKETGYPKNWIYSEWHKRLDK